MAYFQYKKEGQEKESFGNSEPFLKIDKDKLFSMDTTKSGEYLIRILPPWSAKGAYAKSAMIHYRVGKEGRHVVCPNMVGSKICPFCDLAFQLKGTKEFEVDYLAVKAAFRYFSNIVDMTNPKKGVQVWNYGPTNFYAIDEIQLKGDFGDLTSVENGHNIVINRRVQGKSIKDSLYPSPKPTVLDDPDWLDQLVNLDTILPDVDVDLVQELFRSHPFKVYEPHFRLKDEDNIPEFTSPKMEKETKPEVEKSATADEDMEAKIAKMRAKLQSRNAASEG